MEHSDSEFMETAKRVLYHTSTPGPGLQVTGMDKLCCWQ